MVPPVAACWINKIGCDHFTGVEMNDSDCVFINEHDDTLLAMDDADSEMMHATSSAK